MFLIRLFLFLLVIKIYPQQRNHISLLKSAITAIGSSAVSVSNGSYYVHQSIGESGMVGTVDMESTSHQQGFLNYVIANKEENSINEIFDLVIYPNPFIEYLKIDFSKTTHENISVKIYDVLGKIHISKEYLPTDKIKIPIEKLRSGNYLIQIKTGKQTVTQKVCKIENE